MLIQTIGVLLGIVGFVSNIQVLLVIGGIVCIVSDILGYFRGTLKPFFPIILYTLGYFIVGSWIGIFYGSIIGNAIEVIPHIFIIFFSILNRAQAKPVEMPIPLDKQDQYLKETWGITDEELAELGQNQSQPSQAVTVTQITGYPKPKKARLANETPQKLSKTLEQRMKEINQKYDPQQRAHNSLNPQEMQIILHRKTPAYPKKK